MSSKHSPTPWRIDGGEDTYPSIMGSDPEQGYLAHFSRYEDAELIVHRVNTYAELEAERDRYREALKRVIDDVTCGRPWKAAAKAALERSE